MTGSRLFPDGEVFFRTLRPASEDKISLISPPLRFKIWRSQGFPNFAFCATFIVEMTVTIPSERLANITLNERDALVDIAIGLYKREQVSLGRAAEISGSSSPEFLNELGRRRIPINYEAKDLRVDLDALKGLS